MTTVHIKHKAIPILDDVDTDGLTVDWARSVWRHHGGPESPQPWLLTQPAGSAKGKKSKLPEYMLYLLPHVLARIVNLCPWSTTGCRRNCLVYAGRGSSPHVYNGRMARTQLLLNDPSAFMVLLRNDLRRIVKKHGERGAWVRLNGTSDIPWELVPAVVEMMAEFDLEFADYTKASPSERPQPPQIPNYNLARSVWVGKHDAHDIAALLQNEERVSIVTEDPRRLDYLPMVVQADDTDEWLMKPGPVLGVLSPKGPLRYDPANYYSNDVVEQAIAMAT